MHSWTGNMSSVCMYLSKTCPGTVAALDFCLVLLPASFSVTDFMTFESKPREGN